MKAEQSSSKRPKNFSRKDTENSLILEKLEQEKDRDLGITGQMKKSKAVKSMFVTEKAARKKGDRDDWMTRGTFNRHTSGM